MVCEILENKPCFGTGFASVFSWSVKSWRTNPVLVQGLPVFFHGLWNPGEQTLFWYRVCQCFFMVCEILENKPCFGTGFASVFSWSVKSWRTNPVLVQGLPVFFHGLWNPGEQTLFWYRVCQCFFHGLWNPGEQTLFWYRVCQCFFHGLWNPGGFVQFLCGLVCRLSMKNLRSSSAMADFFFFFDRNLQSVNDREICCYSISCKEKHNIGEWRVFLSFFLLFFS